MESVASLSQNGPVHVVPAHPLVEGYEGSSIGRSLALVPTQAYSFSWLSYCLHSLQGMGWFHVVFVSSRVGRRRREGDQLAPNPKPVPSPVGTRVFVGMPCIVSKQAGGLHGRQNESSGEFTASLFVFGS